MQLFFVSVTAHLITYIYTVLKDILYDFSGSTLVHPLRLSHLESTAFSECV